MNQMNSNMNPNMNMGQNNANMMNANQSRMPIQNPGNFGRNAPFVVPNQPGNSNCRLNLANYIQNKHGSNDQRRFPSNPPHMAMVRKVKFLFKIVSNFFLVRMPETFRLKGQWLVPMVR